MQPRPDRNRINLLAYDAQSCLYTQPRAPHTHGTYASSSRLAPMNCTSCNRTLRVIPHAAAASTIVALTHSACGLPLECNHVNYLTCLHLRSYTHPSLRLLLSCLQTGIYRRSRNRTYTSRKTHSPIGQPVTTLTRTRSHEQWASRYQLPT